MAVTNDVGAVLYWWRHLGRSHGTVDWEVPQPPEPGVYAFKTDLSMAGRWLFSISAKVQGEPETVTGKITFRVTK